MGHFADHCAVVITSTTNANFVEELKTLVNKSLMREKKVPSETKLCVTIRTANAFDSLCDSSDEEDKPPSNVTVRKPAKKVVKDWADYESDDE
jgi:hypothetical protein